jgi:hypothetical protein
MGSKISPAIIFFSCLVLPASVSFAFDSGNADFSQTVITLKNGNDQNNTNRIAEEIRKNDHTAKLFRHSDPEKFFIIHHRSLGAKQLKSLITDLGISVEAAAKDNKGTGIEALQRNTQIYPMTERRTCGGTKTAWKKLLRKYSH